ncbi:M28 family peptidase [Pararhodobacter marinus]|uniref:M28 family peptidase n=1 Tax=Pararhodobacter marinus TaxID=2184063 RepID=UPI0035175BE9
MTISDLRRDLARHAGFGEKYTGGPGDLATAAWIETELQAAGYETWRQDVTLPRNRVDRLTLSGLDVALYAQPNMVPGTVTAPLRVIHDRVQAARAARAIAVIRAPYGRHSTIWLPPFRDLIADALEAGAKALVVLPTGPSGDIVGLNTWADRPFAPVPLVIGRPDDLPLYLSNEGQTLTLTLNGAVEPVASPNILARRIAGPRWIGLSTPRTGFFTCLTERGSGTAAFLAMARRLPALYPERSVFLMNTTGHELAFGGTHAALDHAPPPEDTDAWVHLGATLASNDQQETRNGQMLSVADPNRVVMASESLRDACADAFAGLSGLAPPRAVVPGAGELSTIVDLGYRNAFAVLGQGRWFHTPQDTLDKLDPELLAPVVEAHLRALDAGLRL